MNSSVMTLTIVHKIQSLQSWVCVSAKGISEKSLSQEREEWTDNPKNIIPKAMAIACVEA